MMHDIFIWGAGALADRVLKETNTLSEYNVIGVIDSDPRKWSSSFHGYTVYDPSKIETVYSDGIVILSDKIDEITEQIKNNHPKYAGILENSFFFVKDALLKRYEATDDEEIQQVCRYIKNNGLGVFNYPFSKMSLCNPDDMYYDKQSGLFYAKIGKRNLYISKVYNTKEKALEYYRSLLLEQYKDSPHRYLDDHFNVKRDSIVVDVGAAEGIFAIGIIDTVKKIYLVEPDANWVEALQYTFCAGEDKEKITIISKFASSFSFGEYATLDSLINEPIDFLKMDIEGCEWDALLGCNELFRHSKNIKAAICTYHTDYDQELIRNKLIEYGMNCKTTPGYMYFPYRTRTNYPSTKLHRGVMRAYKNEE